MKPSQILCIIGLIIGLVMAMMLYSCAVAAEGLSVAARGFNTDLADLARDQIDFARDMAQTLGIDDPGIDSEFNEWNEQLESERKLYEQLPKELARVRAILIASILVVIIAGVLGIIGPNKKPINIKEKYLSIILFICGVILFPLGNFLSAVLYIIAAILYFLDGKKMIKIKE
jgi:hypothetical protein